MDVCPGFGPVNGLNLTALVFFDRRGLQVQCCHPHMSVSHPEAYDLPLSVALQLDEVSSSVTSDTSMSPSKPSTSNVVRSCHIIFCEAFELGITVDVNRRHDSVNKSDNHPEQEAVLKLPAKKKPRHDKSLT